MPRRTAIWLALFPLFVTACSKTIRVPPSSYSEPGSAVAYHIQTVDDRTYSVTRYVVEDSVIVVEELARSKSANTNDTTTVPFEIPLRDVESIDRVVMDRGKASAWVFGFGAVAAALIFLTALSMRS
jgi:hypothetical protein